MAENTTEQDADGLGEYDDLLQAPESVQRSYWMRELEACAKSEEAWSRNATYIEKKYRDEERSLGGDRAGISGTRQVNGANILYANTETMKGAVYGNKARPVVERRFPGDDEIARLAAEILEKCLTFTIDDSDLHGVMKECRLDYLLPGRATARVYYEFMDDADLSDVEDNDAGEPEEGEHVPGVPKIPEITDQRITFRRFDRSDYRESVDKTYTQTRWKAFGNRLSRKALAKRFGKEKAEKITLDTDLLKIDEDGNDRTEMESIQATWKRAMVWEIWDITNRCVWWVSKGYDGILDRIEDPLGIERFWCSPRPAIAVESNTKKTPVPLFELYRDQADEVDRLTQRIYALVDAVRANGLVAGEHEQTFNKLFSADNELIGISDFATIMDKGGIEKLIAWMPLQPIVSTIIQLYDAREKAKQEIYEISGMADIIRGASDPRETLGAQKIKGQFATIRLEDHQENLARFAQEMVEISGELIAEHFTAETMAKMSGVQLPMTRAENEAEVMKLQSMIVSQIPPDAPPEMMQQASKMVEDASKEIMSRPTWEDVIAVLRDDSVRRYTIRIETDSTIKMDQDNDREQRMAAVEAFGGILNNFGGAVVSGQMPFDLFKTLLLFAIRGFPGSREVEAMISDWKQPPPPPQENQDKPQANPAEAAMIREQGASEREKMKLSANADQAERDRQFKAEEAEKDRKLQVMNGLASVAKAIDDARINRFKSQASMRSGNGA